MVDFQGKGEEDEEKGQGKRLGSLVNHIDLTWTELWRTSHLPGPEPGNDLRVTFGKVLPRAAFQPGLGTCMWMWWALTWASGSLSILRKKQPCSPELSEARVLLLGYCYTDGWLKR